MDMTKVESSDLKSVGYNKLTQTLVIEFRSGSSYEYIGVPQEIYIGLMSATSHGKYFHKYIKNQYPCKKYNL